ncbi:TetR/AcrR family transcriptional regulator [Cellulomonas xylanilytica]|uniref:TetR family transcriptional regulator n=1 Tax=Cellulomonas xylanilytica TaxID=233583 RepID=A0A510V6C1_9CELL|nr:TetR/AcrR family transcriptional regulator [Cellulomonas xylanilytica]GEK22414.1 TetR family transcriptional regulator [Cellulomonas xylanilytica]
MTTQAPTGARSGGYARGRATREEILDVAMQLFGEVGYRTASLREVASRVGISHPGLLHHFASKAVLLAAVLERRDQVDDAAFEADLDAGYDFVDALARVIERNASRPGIVELFATLSAEATSPDHPAHAYFQERYRRVVEGGRAEFERRRDAGELRPGLDPLTASRLTVAVMDGMQIQWLLSAGTPDARPDMAAALRAHVATLLRP